MYTLFMLKFSEKTWVSIAITVFIIIFLISLYLKLVPVLNNNFPFTMDQARDMIDIRRIVELKRPILIGPTTSINGVFLGPFYYYFNLVPFVVSRGDPAALTYWNIAWYMIAGILLFWFFRKEKVFALLISIIFMMAPAHFYSARYFWSANPMPYMTTFYFLSILHFFNNYDKDRKSSFLSILNFSRNKNYINAFLPGLISGLSMQVEAAFGVLFLPFFLIFAAIKRTHIKYLAVSGFAFFLTLVPQIIFELRNNLVMTKVFFSELSGKSQILGDKLSLMQVFDKHLVSFRDFSHGLFEISREHSIIILVTSIVFLGFQFAKKKLSPEQKNIYLLSVGFIIYGFVFYMFYSYALKGWYLLGLRIPYLFLIALFLYQIFKLNWFFKICVVGFLLFSFIATINVQLPHIPKPGDRSSDKSNLRNEMEALDWVYTKAAGKGFQAYNYIPSVYDYPYQYLYWWYGKKVYGYHPQVVTYLDNVPEYIKDNDIFFDARREITDSTIFLIYEKDENQKRLDGWLGNFTKFCTLEKQEYPWGTTVEMRQICAKN